MRNILIVSQTKSYLLTSIEEQMREAGEYRFFWSKADIDELSSIKQEMDAIVLYVEEALVKEQKALVYMRDKAVEEDTAFFVLGDSNDIGAIRSIIPQHIMQKEFLRPIDVKEVVAVVDEYVEHHGRHNKKKILVVDDSGAVLRNVKGWLEDRYQVILANSGTMAIKYLAINRPDLVLLDYEMPVINGKQVLEMIRSESEFSNIPVIFLTSKNDRESITQVVGLKPEGYLLKTMKPEEIVKYIDEFFEKRKRIES